MGERGHSGAGVTPMVREQHAGPWVLAGVLLAALLLSWLPRELDPASRASLALAQSLIFDGDREWRETDRQRLREQPQASGARPPSPPPLVERGGVQVPDATLPYGLYLAPWALFGPRGVLLGHLALLGLAAWVAARTLSRVVGSVAPWLVVLLLLGSALFAYLMRLWAEGFLAALVLLAFAIARGAAYPPGGELSEVYQPPAAMRSPIWRWGGVGFLLGAAAAARLELLPLLLGAAALMPREMIRRGLPALLVAALVAFGGLVVAEGAVGPSAGGPAGWLEAGREGLAVAAGARDTGAPPLGATVLDSGLWKANGLYALLGRHAGVLFFLAPVILLAACAGPGRGRGALAGCVLLSALLALGLRPYTLTAAPWSLGPAALLPAFTALWFVVARGPSRWALGATWAWAAFFLWPAWLSPLASPVTDEGRRPWSVAYLAPWAPFETTQPGLLHHREVAAGALRLSPLTPEARPAAGPGRLMFRGDRRVEVLIQSPQRLAAVNLEVGEGGPAEAEVRGGELAETMLRPDGGVEHMVHLSRPAAQHSLPGRLGERYFYRLSLRLPAGPRELLSMRIAGMPEAPELESTP